MVGSYFESKNGKLSFINQISLVILIFLLKHIVSMLENVIYYPVDVFDLSAKTSLISLDVVYCKFNKIKCYPTIQLFCVVIVVSLMSWSLVDVMMVKTDRKQRMLDSWDEIIEDEDEVTEN